MFSNLIKYLNKSKIEHSVLKGQKVASFTMRTQNGNFNCIADVKEENSVFIFYTIFGVIIPENKRLVASELLTRINYGLIIGNFEMDIEDGEIRFKTSIDFEGSKLLDKFIDNIISANLSIVDNYCLSIFEVISSERSPKEILNKYEILEPEPA